MSVAVYEVTAGITTWVWLCDPCVAARAAKGWTVKSPAPLPDGACCTDCDIARQGAEGYETPTVDFAPTDTESRLPDPGFASQQPGSRTAETWADRMARLRVDAKWRAA